VPGSVGFALVEECLELGVYSKLRAVRIEGLDAVIPRSTKQGGALRFETFAMAHSLDPGAQHIADRREPARAHLRFSEAGNVLGNRGRTFGRFCHAESLKFSTIMAEIAF
jgi:hypothetical protein